MKSRIFSHLLLDLADRITALRASGLPEDAITATQLQRQLDDLRANAATITFREHIRSPFLAWGFRDALPDIVNHWRLLNPDLIIIPGFAIPSRSADPEELGLAITKAKGIAPAVHLSYGARGSVTITPDRLTYTGDLANNPEALLAGVVHMRKYWSGGCRLADDDFALEVQHPDYIFHLTVAAEMVGLIVRDPRIPKKSRWSADPLAVIPDSHSKEDVQELKEKWAPILKRLQSPAFRPPEPSRSRFRRGRARTSAHAST